MRVDLDPYSAHYTGPKPLGDRASLMIHFRMIYLNVGQIFFYKISKLSTLQNFHILQGIMEGQKVNSAFLILSDYEDPSDKNYYR